MQLSLGQPVISVDTQKKELVGPFCNGGRELRLEGEAERILRHNFVIVELGPGETLRVSHCRCDEARVSVGADFDAAALAVESLRRWWRTMGEAAFRDATRLLTADAPRDRHRRYRESRPRSWTSKVDTS